MALYTQRVRLWIASILAGTMCASAAAPALAQVAINEQTLADYAQSQMLILGTDTVSGYQQVFAMLGDEKIYLTSGSRNRSQPFSVGQYVVWVDTVNGAGQIVLYDLASETALQLTDTGTNQNPKVNEYGHVVWERWAGDRWQLFYFDGLSVQPLTSGDVSVYPELLGNQLLFSKKSSAGVWSAYQTDLGTMQTTLLMEGSDAEHPHWEYGLPFFPVKEARELEEAKILAWQKQVEEEARLAQELADMQQPVMAHDALSLNQQWEQLLDTASTTKSTPVGSDTPPSTVNADVVEIPTSTDSSESIVNAPVSSTEHTSTDAVSGEQVPATPPDSPPAVTDEDIQRELTDTPLIVDVPVSTQEPDPSLPVEPQSSSPGSEPAVLPVTPTETTPDTSSGGANQPVVDSAPPPVDVPAATMAPPPEAPPVVAE